MASATLSSASANISQEKANKYFLCGSGSQTRTGRATACSPPSPARTFSSSRFRTSKTSKITELSSHQNRSKVSAHRSAALPPPAALDQSLRHRVLTPNSIDQVSHDPKINHQHRSLHCGRMPVNLINLHGYQAARDDHGKPLSPTFLQPQPGPLGQEQRGIQKTSQAQFLDLLGVQVCRLGEHSGHK